MKDKEFEVEKIRAQYEKQVRSELDELKALDAKVKRPARIFGYTCGITGTIIAGAGMSLVMTDIGAILGMREALIPGIVIGVAGLAVCCVTYPVYQKILTSRKKKYAHQILELSERIMKG